MEIFMRNVPKHAAEIDVLIELAQRIHQAPFPTEPKINFDVDLFANRYPGADKHSGNGILTLPTIELGILFLRSYGQAGLFFRGNTIRFTEDRKPRRNEGLMHKLRTHPWEDPDRLRQQEERLLEDSQPVTLTGFSFGCFCPDGIFSEERDCEAAILLVMCDPILRRLAVKASSSLSNAATVRSAIVSAPQIAGISSGQSEPFQVILEIDSLPIFTRGTNLVNEDSTTTRTSSFGDELHIPYPCRHMRLRFYSSENRDLFLYRSKRLKLPRLIKQSIRVERRELYQSAVLSRLPSYFLSLNFDLAFEAEKNVTVGLILPAEIPGIVEEVVVCASRHELDPEAHVAPILRLFAFSLTVPGLRSRFQPSINPPRWYRRHLAIVAKNYVAQLKRPLPLFSPTTSRRNARHLTLTPASKILDGPMHGQSNSVLRQFGHPENFLRVSFEDEDRSKPKGGQDFNIKELLDERYKRALLYGIFVAGRCFEFLGYSMSGLKEYSFFFVYPFFGDAGRVVDAEEIRGRLGDFSRIVHFPALLGARWAQAFSNTAPSVQVTPEQVVKIDDRRSASGSVFTDGVGTISPALLWKAWRKLKLERTDAPSSVPSVPSVLQIRLGGAKGVVSLDNMISNDREIVCIRPSQQKFDTRTALSLDIAGASTHPLPMFLNRPLIVILEYLGVAPQTFLDLQQATVNAAREVRASMEKAAGLFAQNGLGGPFELPSLFHLVTKLFGVDIGVESSGSKIQHELIEDCLMYGSLHVLREIKHHARIPVPGSYTLFGVADEYDCLEEGEIFATVFDERRGRTKTLTGPIAITRSPQVHPGDVQMVTAVDKPELQHLKNAVVFSCRGDRSLPSCLGGGDLDGDIYNLILNPELHPLRTYGPGNYTPLPRKETDHPCVVADVADFVMDYIQSDVLGKIGILHLRFADYVDPGCNECLRLSIHYSNAVDYPKTGTPVSSSDLPRPPSKTKPDFLAGEGKESTGKKFYPSPKILGTLFRDVEMDDPFPDRSDEGRHPTDGAKISTFLKQLEPSLTDDPSSNLVEDMKLLLDAYINQLTVIAKANTLSRDSNDRLSEGELVSGTIMSTWGDHRKRKSAAEQMNNQMRELTSAVRKEIRRRRTNLDAGPESSNDGNQSDSDDEDLDEDPIEGFRSSWAAWLVAENALAENRNEFGPQSFGLIALGLMLRLSKQMQDQGFGFSRLPS